MIKQCSKCKKLKDINEFKKRPERGSSAYSTICKECINYRNRQRFLNPELRIRRLYSGIKYRCKKKNIPFNLEISDIIIPEFCPVLGTKLKFCTTAKSGMIDDSSPSIDRLIPDLGYVKNNIRVISWRANQLRCDGTSEEHLAIAKYIEDRS